MKTMTALALGVVSAVGTDVAARRVMPDRTVPAAAAGLVTAAVVYPAARVGRVAAPAVVRRERIAVAAAGGLLAAAASPQAGPRFRRAVAGGWVAHAVFDNVHDRGSTSRLPDWYPALCAGYDVALAALLLRRR